MKKEKPDSIILTGDFNARSPAFWEGESTQTTEGASLSNFCLLNGLKNIIQEPTHLPQAHIATCIDLILTDQIYSFTESGVIPSPDSHLKHQIIYGKVNFGVPCPPPYKRRLWKYELADIHLIRERLANTNWNQLFFNKNLDDMVQIFSSLFLGVMKTSIPNKMVTIDDRDAPWVTPEVKSALNNNRRIYASWVKKGRLAADYLRVQLSQSTTNSIVTSAKKSYIDDLSRKLCDPTTGPKAFRTAFKCLANKKKITNIPPLVENGLFIPNFKEKANIFNDYFALQC